MRRTYRSKKDASGALDHKDVLLDEKSSAFDAFYIQNIKQTKREVSSVNYLAAPPSKVRKRKYVKRIIKDPEPQKESILDSVYLTPNKSLRVNKPLDPFDQLLNSPSTQRNDSLRVNRDNLFCYQKVTKTYHKKRLNKLKKYNYSSSDTTESDKENFDSSRTPDTSNIKKHELLIEKPTKKISTNLDKSIKDLVQNFSLLKKVSPKTPGKSNNPMKLVKNRLTFNIQSPILQSSPLCSTPFKEKYRGKSIYNFSPIHDKNFNETLDMDASQNKSSDSIIFVEKKRLNLSNKQEISICKEVCKSPVFKTPDNYKAPSTSIETGKNNLINSVNEKTCEAVPLILLEPKNSAVLIEGEENDESQVQEEIENHNCNKSYNKVVSSIEISSLQTTEMEPFMGFSNNEHAFNEGDHKNDSHNTQGFGESVMKESNRDESRLALDSINNSNLSQYNHSLETSIMLCSNDDPENEINEGRCSDNPKDNTVLDNSVKLSESLEEAGSDISRENEDNNLSEQSANKSSNDFSDLDTSQSQNVTIDPKDVYKENDASQTSVDKSLSQESDNQSLYDTCDSGDTTQEDSFDRKLPIVELNRLNNSIFQKYYNDMPKYDATERSGSSQDSKDYESVDNISDHSNKSIESYSNSENVKSIECSSNSDNVQEFYNLDTSNDISDDNDSDSNSNTDEDRCISFVTTRRRNEVTNDSMILGFNDSYESVSNSECDKTVLSNNRNSNRKSDLNEATLVVNDKESSKIFVPTEDIEPVAKRASNVTSKVASERESFIKAEEPKYEFVEPKPSIVLQPGKKWERSLSIYRRMTTMNDHFDNSLLEEEPMQSKGRKYRQSVINTMELQDRSILHNESINSRRSTFVSKPCRSTIKIVKEPNNSRTSLCATAVFDDLKGFLSEDCDETIVELSKLSIADSKHEVTVLENFHDTAGRIATARDYVLRRCNQTEVLLFDECYPDTVLKNCHKIGEGVYGEVFLWRARDGRARVMKIVPIAGATKVNGEYQKDYHEIISEIVIAMELSALRAPIADIERHFDEGKDVDALDLHAVENATDVFNEVLAVRCVYGCYPSRLLDLWELYDECKGSENDNPAILPVDQQYIVLELANAGQDLESYQFNSAEQAHALFLQVAFALAVGEESFQFEHRDLHWGNVLISPTEQKFATFVLRGRAHRVARCGVAATVIDYSLSRLSLPLAGSDRAALYNDLSTDDGLFDALGDYQFEVYRRMRDKLGNDWKNFEPYTNILWLHYTVDKMITALRYKRTNTKIHKHYIAKLKGIKNRILNYGSAAQFVLTDNEF
ncbi:uncharacterized protein LOC106137006 [Amyelois transitella]|uniref:uncharacterized protein LOC106137006 n=1 Tax=Amyelois transitella TaxID=680683 RepID=UPI00067B854D|nr:uncharacterized protein LOC106137006 [Amyelois transitella]